MSRASSGDRLFFILQGALKFVAFDWAVFLRGVLYRPFFREFGERVKILDNVTIKYPSEIRLGDHVRINEGCYLVGFGGLSIGAFSMLGAGTKLVTTSHNFEQSDVPMVRQGLNFSSVEIGEDVWFGFDSVVLGGSTIRKGVIVGAGAVVLGGEIPDYSIVGGVPARIIGNRLQRDEVNT